MTNTANNTEAMMEMSRYISELEKRNEALLGNSVVLRAALGYACADLSDKEGMDLVKMETEYIKQATKEYGV